jgi:hypothetical protein
MAEIVCNHLSQVCLLIPKWYGMSEMNKKKNNWKNNKVLSHTSYRLKCHFSTDQIYRKIWLICNTVSAT